MGVRGLLSYCKSITRHADMTSRAARIGIDGFSLLYLFKEDQTALESYLRGLLALDHKVKIIMDKRAAEEKKETVEKRKEVRQEAKVEAKQLETYVASEEFKELLPAQQKALETKLAQANKKAWCLSRHHTKWFKKLLEELSIELVYAEEEADEVLAAGEYDIVVSSDSDLLILGVKCLWIPRGCGHGIQHNEIQGKTFQTLMGLNSFQLKELAFLAGCDVQPRSIVSVEKARGWLRWYGSLDRIHARFPDILKREDLDTFAGLLEGAWRQRENLNL